MNQKQTSITIMAIIATAILGLILHCSSPAYAAPAGDRPSKSGYGATNILASAATKAFTAISGRNSFLVQNRGPNSIFCGYDSAVATTTGIEVVSGGFLNVDLFSAGTQDKDVFCIAATADQTSPLNTRWMQVK